MSQNNAPHDETFLISFIITYYNIPPDMLRQCVESILALDIDEGEREILLVDDGSSIDPRPLLGDYDGGIRYIRQDNRGVAAARNRGLEEAHGTHIQFVDADDCLLKPGYEHCMLLARNRGVDIVTFDYCEGKALPQDAPGVNYESFTTGPQYMLRHNLRGIDWAYLFRRSILNGLRFTEGLLHEDEEFVALLLLRAQSVASTTAKAYFYRQREGSIVSSKDKAHLEKRLADMQHIISVLHEKAKSLDAPKSEALLRRVHQLCMDHIYNTIVLTADEKRMEDTVAWLRARDLFPLPCRHYTLKYSLFRIATATRLGRKILLWILK